MTQSLRKFEAWHAGSGFGYPILRTIHVNGSIAYYHYIAGNAFYKRDTYHATLGLAWSPSTIPVSIW